MSAVPFSTGTESPRTPVPPRACDCHVHVYDAAIPAAEGARLNPPPASVDDYRRLQSRIGTSRVVLVTPSTYGTDNRAMLAGLRAFGADARGVAVIAGDEPDAELQRLHAAGVRGIRMNLSLGGGPGLARLSAIASRVAPLGWHVQLLMPADLLATQEHTLSGLPVPLVFDHLARIAPTLPRHAAHAVLLQLLAQGKAWVKLSGGYLVSPQQSVEDPALNALARTYIEAASEGVVWGSDWPHATASAGLQPMPDDARQVDRLADWAENGANLHRILVTNPERLYGFGS
ncbi:amidohydrolase family protein [Ramlibacter ginsenosidimutans]|uniref:Amidohydrolase family protein n=1 Tax=Ramlibacter ginsenosidimutans TaxID=502333 RepID=A0A934WP50_9BURK|nr:amidohydrolase family protein [Ramlibacter ginsenosidimutans]MBK6007937.1 amidohydrolase family protein [Ramlibacter ginsenosidimutans]